MNTTLKQKLGYQPLRSEQLFLQSLIKKNFDEEIIIIHHIFNSPHKLILQIERQNPNNPNIFSRCTFERISI